MSQTWATTSTNDGPLTRIHRAVAHALLSDAKLIGLVKPGNFYLHLDKMPNQMKPVASDSDLPELSLYPNGLPLNGSPSDGMFYTRSFTIAVTTGDQRVNKGCDQIEESILRIVHALRDKKCGLPDLVIDFRFTGATEQLTRDDAGRPLGWNIAFGVDVRFRTANWEVGVQ
jgi:hypothetical protein